MEARRKKIIETMLMDTTPSECRLRIQMLKRRKYITDAKEQIAMVEEHLEREKRYKKDEEKCCGTCRYLEGGWIRSCVVDPPTEKHPEGKDYLMYGLDTIREYSQAPCERYERRGK